jgi:hypothetical protein
MKNLEDMLGNTDFSRSGNKDAMKNRLLLMLEENNSAKGMIIMKQLRFKTIAAVVLLLGIPMAFYGRDMIRIIRQFTVGEHATFTIIDDGGREPERIDAEQRLEWAKAHVAANPGHILGWIEENGDRTFVSAAGVMTVKAADEIYTYFNTVDDAKPYLAFSPLMPGILPDGFALDRIGIVNVENGRLDPNSSKYLSVFFVDAGKSQEIYMQIKLMDEETAFGSSHNSLEMRSITVNGYEGVVDGKSIHVEIDGIMYMIRASGEDVTQEDVIRMAESLM